MLVTGAAGYAAASAEIDTIGTVRVDPAEVPGLKDWAGLRLAEWRQWLKDIQQASPSFGPPYGEGWGIDKWDSNRNPRQSRYPLY